MITTSRLWVPRCETRHHFEDFIVPIASVFDILWASLFNESLVSTGRVYLQGIPGAPLWDSSLQQFVGMLTASDFISILQRVRFCISCLSLFTDSIIFYQFFTRDMISLMKSYSTFLSKVALELLASWLIIDLMNDSYHFKRWIMLVVKHWSCKMLALSVISVENHYNCSICAQLGNNGASVFSEEELEMHTIEEWKKEKQALFPSAVHALAYVSASIWFLVCGNLS